MKSSYEILPERALVRVTYPYHPTYRQWSEMIRTVFSDPNFRIGFDFIFDKRRAGEAASREYVEAVSAFYRANADKFGRCAIVTDGLLAFGMSRMTEGYCVGERVRAFDNIEAANRWLQSAADSVSPACISHSPFGESKHGPSAAA